MTTVAELAGWIEEFAPRRLAESWDNVGLLWGDPAASVSKIMTCLTVTAEVADEAIAMGVSAIVSHHPILFRPVQAIRADDRATGFLWRLARFNTAVISPHTAFDNTVGGINDIVAEAIGLRDVRGLRPSTPAPLHKVVAFVPPADREKILSAAFAAGAGTIGAYDHCSFTGAGKGTFRGDETTNPTVGQSGRVETVREWKIEMVCRDDRLAAVLAAVRSAHSYEEPAIDVFSIRNPDEGPGVGRIGSLPDPLPLGDLAMRVAIRFGSRVTQFAGDEGRPIRRVAIACGAGDELLADAARAGADAFLTGESRFHRVLEAEARSIGLILAGHHATERIGVEWLARRLAQSFPGVEVWASSREHDPLNPIRP